MILIYASTATTFTDNGLGGLNPTSCIVNETLNGDYSLTMKHPIDAAGKWQKIAKQRIIKVTTHDGSQLFRIYSVEKNIITKSVDVEARHIFYDLLNNFIESTVIDGKTGTQAGAAILAGCQYPSGFTFSTNIATTASTTLTRINPVQAFIGDDALSFVNVWGGEIRRNNTAITINTRRGADNGAKVTYRKNMVGMTVREESDEIVTRIFPIVIGAGNTIVLLPEKVVDSDRLADYPAPLVGLYKIDDIPVDSDEYPTDDDIYTAMRARCATKFAEGIDLPKMTFDVDLVDLTKTEQYSTVAPIMALNLGDDVTVTHAEFSVALSLRVVRVKWDALLQKYLSVTIGDKTSALEDYLTTVGKDIDTLKNALSNKWFDEHSKNIIPCYNSRVAAPVDAYNVAIIQHGTILRGTWTGKMNIAIGYSAGITGQENIAIGPRAEVVGKNNTAVGKGAYSVGDYNVSVGDYATTYGLDATAIGKWATAGDDDYAAAHGFIAIGESASAWGLNSSDEASIAVGADAQSFGNRSISVGKWALSSGDDCIAMGYSSASEGVDNIVVGRESSADGSGNIIIGALSSSEDDYNIVSGYYNQAHGDFNVLSGNSLIAKSDGGYDIVMGHDASVDNQTITGHSSGYQIVMGNGATVSGQMAIAPEDYYDGWDGYSIALGNGANVRGGYNVAIGTGVRAHGADNIVLGDGAYVGNTANTSVGHANVSIGSAARVASGNNNVLIGKSPDATGNNNIVIGDGAATGNNLIKIGYAQTGAVVIDGASDDGVTFNSMAVDKTPLRAKAKASQTAPIMTVQDASGNVVNGFGHDGMLMDIWGAM